jgi:ElaB/YqjD/DUF883 family membrane-anchored ribosome-binding protein
MTGPSDDANVTALRQEIAQTRAELGETVEALSARVDVRARTQEMVDETKARAREVVAEAKAKAVQKAHQVAESGQELVQEARTDPTKAAQHVVERVRTSVQAKPRQWAVAAAALLAFGLLIARRRAKLASGEWPRARRKGTR